jgi:hypothetical protein
VSRQAVHGIRHVQFPYGDGFVEENIGGFRAPAILGKSNLLIFHRSNFQLVLLENSHGAGDEIRTHDPNLGKVMLYP